MLADFTFYYLRRIAHLLPLSSALFSGITVIIRFHFFALSRFRRFRRMMSRRFVRCATAPIAVDIFISPPGRAGAAASAAAT
jgi:hypothetical protein